MLNLSILYSGFTQSRRTVNGLVSLREELLLHSRCAVKERVWYNTWNSNVEDVAEDIVNLQDQYHQHVHITACGYSYGGWAVLQFCKALLKRGVNVDHLVLCDPVGRSWFWPPPLPAITSLLSRRYAFKLCVPQNVKHVYSFFQTTNRPQGHRLKYDIRTTMVFEPVQLELPHMEMDDASEFHELFLSLVEKARCAT